MPDHRGLDGMQTDAIAMEGLARAVAAIDDFGDGYSTAAGDVICTSIDVLYNFEPKCRGTHMSPPYGKG